MGRRRIGFDELTFLNRQLASMARLNLPFTEGLRALAEEVDARDFRALIREVLAELEEGKPLSAALRKRGDVFSDLYVGIVEAGEESGDLGSALEGLADYSESMLFLRQRVRASLAYPSLACGVALAMIVYLFTGLMPRFGAIFESLDIGLPPLTEFYLGLATGMRNNGLWILLGLVGVVIAILLIRRIAAGARTLRQFALNLPFYGKLLRQVLLLRFCETMKALLRSNVSLVPALDLTARTMGNNVLRRTVEDMAAAAEEGRRISDPLRRNTVFPRTFVWKFALAEEQGTLEATLGEMGEFFEKQLRSVTSRFSSLLEPFLIAIVGIVVGSLVLAVFLPIFNLQAKMVGL
jgi:type IV pilus assembly protein PilC